MNERIETLLAEEPKVSLKTAVFSGYRQINTQVLYLLLSMIS